MKLEADGKLNPDRCNSIPAGKLYARELQDNHGGADPGLPIRRAGLRLVVKSEEVYPMVM